MNYDAYLQSAEWRAKRYAAIVRADWRCQVCNAVGELEVHHRTYERLGQERDGDLTVLCADCHELFKNRKPKPYLWFVLPPDMAAIKEMMK